MLLLVVVMRWLENSMKVVVLLEEEKMKVMVVWMDNYMNTELDMLMVQVDWSLEAQRVLHKCPVVLETCYICLLSYCCCICLLSCFVSGQNKCLVTSYEKG